VIFMKEITFQKLEDNLKNLKENKKIDKSKIEKFKLSKEYGLNLLGIDSENSNSEKNKQLILNVIKKLSCNKLSEYSNCFDDKNLNLENLYKLYKNLKKISGDKEVSQTVKDFCCFLYKCLKYEYTNILEFKYDDEYFKPKDTIWELNSDLIKLNNHYSHNDEFGKEFQKIKLSKNLGLNLLKTQDTQYNNNPLILELIKLFLKLDEKIFGSSDVNLITQEFEKLNDKTKKLQKLDNTIKLINKLIDQSTQANLNLNGHLDFYTFLFNCLKYEDKYAVTKEIYEHNSSALFPNELPKIDDLNQTYFGDCYLISSLRNIVEKKPKLIKNCFLKSNYDENDDYIKIRLFQIEISSKLVANEDDIIKNDPDKFIDYVAFKAKAKNPIIIKVKNTIAKDKEKKIIGNKGAPWVNFMEKAFAIYRNNVGWVSAKKGDSNAEVMVKQWYEPAQKNDPSIKDAEGGPEFIAACAITGLKTSVKGARYISHKFSFYKDFKEQINCNTIRQYIKSRLQNGYKLETSFNKANKSLKIYKKHSYSINKIDDNNIYLINSWEGYNKTPISIKLDKYIKLEPIISKTKFKK